MALPTGDHASDRQSEGCLTVDCNKLVLQFYRWAGYPISARSHRMETVPHAWILLRV